MCAPKCTFYLYLAHYLRSAIQKINFYKSIPLPLWDVHSSIPLLDPPWNQKRDCCLHRNINFSISQDAKFIFEILCSTQRTGWNLPLSQILCRVVVGEAKKAQSARPTKKNTTTTMRHLHDGTVSQFPKILHHILKSAWRNLRLTKRITLHITGIKPLCWYYIPHKVSEQFVQLPADRIDVVHTL